MKTTYKNIQELARIARVIGSEKGAASSLERVPFISAVQAALEPIKTAEMQSEAILQYRQERRDLMASTDPEKRSEDDRKELEAEEQRLRDDYQTAILEERARREHLNQLLASEGEFDIPMVLIPWTRKVSANDQALLIRLGLMDTPTPADIAAMKKKPRKRRGKKGRK